MTAGDQAQREDSTVSVSRRVPLSVIPITPFGKYTLIGKLGHGGMAEVFLAYVAGPAGFRKLCVLKRLHPHLEDEPGFLDMFLDEARLAARLNHPNVIQTYEVGEAESSHFIAMEYLEGQGLDRLRQRCIRTDTRLPPHVSAHIVLQALEGLHYAHNLKDFDGTDLGVIHRDVSPQNVFVTYEGSVKLLDFGIAKAATHVVETRTGVIKGKFAYIAPEQARGEEIDLRADIWSMGVVLWEALTAKRLFKGPNDVATLSEALTGKIPRVDEVVDDAPPTLVDIVGKALMRDPNERYSTASEFRNDLRKFLVTESPSTSREEVAEFIRSIFGDIIKQNKKVLKLCLSDASAEQGLTTGEFRMLTKSPTGELDLGSTSGSYSSSGSESFASGVVVTRTPVSGVGLTPVSGSGITPHSQQSFVGAAPPQGNNRNIWIVLLILLPIIGIGFGWLLNTGDSTETTVASNQPPPEQRREPTNESTPVQSTVRFTSTPEGADVLYGNEILGQTPFEHSLGRLPSGAEASFVFRLSDHGDLRISSPIQDERITVHADFSAAAEANDGDEGEGQETDEQEQETASETPSRRPAVAGRRPPRWTPRRNARPTKRSQSASRNDDERDNQQASAPTPTKNDGGNSGSETPARQPERPRGVVLDDTPTSSVPIIN